MTKSLGIQNIVVIAIACAILVLLYSLTAVDVQREKVNKSEANTFVFTSKRLSKENEILTVYLQNHGGSLDCISTSDFSWYLNNEFMGSAYCISLHPTNGPLQKGETVQVDLKAEKFKSGDKIVLIFRGVHRIVFTI